MGIREVQRLAGLSSSGSTKYYLDRLVELGFAERKGDYIAKINRESLFSIYVGILGSVVPRLIPYAIFSTALVVGYVIFADPPIEALIIAVFPIIFLWIEGIRLTRLLRKILKS